MKEKALQSLSSYVEALYPIIYIQHFDFKVIDEIISKIDENAKIFEFQHGFGAVNFNNKNAIQQIQQLDNSPGYNQTDFAGNLYQFLDKIKGEGFLQKSFIILKNVHKELSDPRVQAVLNHIADKQLYNDNYHATIFLISNIVNIPYELESYITLIDIPLPTLDEIQDIINEFIQEYDLKVEQNIINELARSLKGMNEFQIKRTLCLSYYEGGDLNLEDKAIILNEKEQIIKKSSMLELINFKESLKDIGGLDLLKEWLEAKAKIFVSLDKAIRFGVDVPKGILIMGMPGCGKSLAAKATASLFEIPLVRLDVGRLLGKYIGESEENMRRALALSEAISPCVLWIDEIEKAFSGLNTGVSHEVTTRLFGQFLTWLQEKENSVFIVATANNIDTLPPEFLRKGRFDEIFFVDLPNQEERLNILKIHIKKRKQWQLDFDLQEVVKRTNGFNGADIEALVKETVEKAFLAGNDKITQGDLLDTLKDIKSISSILSKKIDSLRQAVKEMELRPASK